MIDQPLKLMRMPPTFRFPQVGERQNGSFSSSSSMCPRNSHLLYLDHCPSRGCECVGACLHERSIDRDRRGPSRHFNAVEIAHFHGKLSWRAAVEGEPAPTRFRQPPYVPEDFDRLQVLLREREVCIYIHQPLQRLVECC